MSVVGGQPKNTELVIKQQNTSKALFLSLISTNLNNM